MYTTDHLIQDCVGQFIEKQPYSINRSSLLNDRQYCEVWTSLLQWTEKQIKRGNSFIIPHLGLIQCSDPKEGGPEWTCFVESQYLTQHNAKLGTRTAIASISQEALHSSPGIKCHISSLLQHSPSLSESQIRVGLRHIFTKLAQQIERSATSIKNYADIDPFERHLKIIINFGWGYLAVSDGVMDFLFTVEEPLIITPSIPHGLRHIPKRYLQSTASLLSVASIPSGVKISDSTHNDSSDGSQFSSATQQLLHYRQRYKLPVDNDHDNPLVLLASTDTIPESSHEKSSYPPVLSEFSRTLGASYCTHTNYEAPSSKIALFYTPTASLYRINTEQKRIEYTDFLPFFQSHPERYYARNARKLLQYELKYRVQHADDAQAAAAESGGTALEISALDLDIASSCRRYHEYIQHRMPHDFIPPIGDDLIAKILAKLEPDLTLISQCRVEQILEENLKCIQSQNLVAAKQSILDYILRSSTERVRLGIAVPPHHIAEWGYSPLPFSAPLSWGQRLQDSWSSMNASSYFANRGIIEMLSLWQKYKRHRLFGTASPLPDDDRLDLAAAAPMNPCSESADSETVGHLTESMATRRSFSLPMTIQEFRDYQEEHLERTRSLFVNNWYNDAVGVMKKYVEENALDSSEESTLRLFNAIAAFMARQLCEIVYHSLADCVAFFEKYLGAPSAVSRRRRARARARTDVAADYDGVDDDALDDEDDGDSEEMGNVLDIEAVPLSTAPDIQPLWRIALELSRDGIDFEVPLDSIAVAVSDVIEGIIGCFEGISCVEGKIFGLLENVPALTVFIDDGIKKEARERCLEITASFVSELEVLREMYSAQFSPLFAANDELTNRLTAIEQGDGVEKKEDLLRAFQREIGRYEAVGEEVSAKAHSRLRVGLFEVECQAINSLVVDHAQDLKNGITNHVASALIAKAQKLVIRYEDGSKIMLKKPERAQELVDLIEYIEAFEGGEYAECQSISDDIGQELKFLFAADHSLSHDLLRSVGRVSDWNQKIIRHKATADENRVRQRQFIESCLAEQCKQFEQKTKRMFQEVEDLQLLSEIRDTSRIDQLKEDLLPIADEKDYLIQQQMLLQLDVSEFKIFNLLQEAVAKL